MPYFAEEELCFSYSDLEVGELAMVKNRTQSSPRGSFHGWIKGKHLKVHEHSFLGRAILTVYPIENLSLLL